VVYYDSSAGFSAERMDEIVLGRMQDPEALNGTLAQVRMQRVSSMEVLLEALEDLRASLTRGEHTHLGLVIIDSVTPLLFPLLNGAYTQSRALMAHLAMILRSMAQSFDIAVVVRGLLFAALPFVRGLLTHPRPTCLDCSSQIKPSRMRPQEGSNPGSD
jgi:hypothetical protein